MAIKWHVEEAIAGHRTDEGPSVYFHKIVDESGKILATTFAGPNERVAVMMASAPDLIEALRFYAEGEQDGGEVARAAIDRARGRA